MNCEHCKYCHGGQLPESYEEEWFCEKGFANPMEDNGCMRFWMFITEPFRGIYHRIKYRKLLRGFKEEEHDAEMAEKSYLLYRGKNCVVSRNAHNHMHKDWRNSGIDRHKAYTDGYLAGLKAGRNGAKSC